MGLTAKQVETLARLLDQAFAMPADSQQELLDGLAYDDRTKTRLRELLADEVKPEAKQSQIALPESSKLLEFGLVGPYRLLSELGRGGMGTVWLAERADGQLKRRIALKLPLAGLYSKELLERFDRERDIVAALAHPNIARLYDAGVSHGQPFLALEYIEGATLAQYCDTQRLPVRARLGLFLQVLGAVQYAHAHLVIHRDLKPSNILVTSEGQAKLLDFGTAKLLTDSKTTDLTLAGGRALTPNYASPEQMEGDAVTTASDIYSLGIVLFELLTGERPFKAGRTSTRGSQATLPATEPEWAPAAMRPSQAVTGEKQAQARSTTVKKLKQTVKGDLDTIVQKAMRGNPEERYPTADAFGQDIERYLAGEAVLAQPESSWYRAKKFLLRHRVAAIVTALVCAAILSALALALSQSRAARLEARRSAAGERFLEDIFNANSADQADPQKARETTARELLDIGARNIDKELEDAPAAKLKIAETLQSMYRDLGLDNQAVTLGRKAAAIAGSIHGKSSTEEADALIQLAGSLHASQFVNERAKVLAEAKAILDDKGEFASERRALLDRSWAEHYQSTDLAKSQEYATQAVQVFRRLGPSQNLSEALFMEALAFQWRNEFKQAEASVTEAISISKKVRGDPNSSLARYYATLGESQEARLEFSGAEQSLRDAVRAAVKFNGDEHVDTAETEMRLGQFLFYTSRPADGLQHLQKAKDLLLQLRGASDAFYTPAALLEYGWALVNYGRIEEGLEFIEKAVANRRTNRPGTRYLGQMLEYQAAGLVDLGFYPQADQLLSEAAVIYSRVGERKTYTGTEARAIELTANGNGSDAAALLDSYVRENPAGDTLTRASLRSLQAKSDAATDRGDAKSALAIAELTLKQITNSPQRFYLQSAEARAALRSGDAYLVLNQPAMALPLLERTVELRRQLLDGASPALADSELALADCKTRLEDVAGARLLVAQAKKSLTSHRSLGKQYTDRLQVVETQLANRKTRKVLVAGYGRTN